MIGKCTESGEWIRNYLQEQGVDTSCWDSYGILYNRYRARIRKYKPKTYQEFLATCTFRKQRRRGCGPEDLGDYERELGGWGKKKARKKAKKPKELKELKIIIPEDPPFPMERWLKDQKKEWEQYKLRMKRYREDKIRNLTQQGENGRMKDRIPYLFRYALRCLSGTYPEECFPETLNSYKEELQKLLEEEMK